MFDFLNFAKQYNVPYATTGKSISRGWVGVHCPFCVPRDKGFHLGFHTRTGHFSCWKCGYHPVPETIYKLTKFPYSKVDEIINQYQVIGSRGTNKIETSFVDEVTIPTKSLSKSERQYLTDRGFDSSKLIEQYDLRSGGVFGVFKYRIVIPVYQHGRLVSAVGRTIVDGVFPKYKSLSNAESIMPIKHTLFGLDMVVPSRSVILVEGPFDQMRIGPGSIALFGVGVDSFQKETISRLFDNVYILFDADDAGVLASEKLAFDLKSLGVFQVEILSGFHSPDPGSFTEQEVREVRSVL
jgi:DNA primase